MRFAVGKKTIKITLKNNNDSFYHSPSHFVAAKSLGLIFGSYSVIPVFNQKYLDLPFHCKRLCDSYKALGNLQRSDEDIISKCLHSLNVANLQSDGLVTVCVGNVDQTELQATSFRSAYNMNLCGLDFINPLGPDFFVVPPWDDYFFTKCLFTS